MKKVIAKILRHFGYGIKRLERNYDKILHDISKRDIEEPIIFDVGANIGQSIERFFKLYDNPKIYSFEPTPKLYSLLKNKFKYENLNILNYALTNHDKMVNFNVHQISIGSSSIEKVKINSRFAQKRNLKHNILQINIQGMTLDKFCRDNKINTIHLLKIDVQSHEKEVLEGSLHMLKNQFIDIIEIEVIIGDAYENRLNFYDIEQYLLPNNYRLASLSPDGRFYNLEPHDIFLNNELQFDCIYVSTKYLNKLNY